MDNLGWKHAMVLLESELMGQLVRGSCLALVWD